MIVDTDAKGFVRDTNNNAILRNDYDSLLNHRKMIKGRIEFNNNLNDINNLRTEIFTMKKDISEMKEILHYLQSRIG